MREFVALDFETAKGDRASACQIGLVLFRDGEIVETYESLIQPPGNEYFYQNMRVHGITPAHTENSPKFIDIWPHISRLIENRVVVAHNAPFDNSVLQSCLKYYNLSKPDYEVVCTLSLTGTRLNIACECRGIELEHHNALSDAIACGKLFQHLIDHKDGFPENITKPTQKIRYHPKVNSETLNPDFDNCCKDSPFYRKKVVITGLFNSYSREGLASKLKSMGGDVNTTLSAKTDFVISGSESGPVKLKKYEILKASGSQIQKIQEEDFVSFGLI
jgi:DNA polymerase-3 subunit epsilon